MLGDHWYSDALMHSIFISSFYVQSVLFLFNASLMLRQMKSLKRDLVENFWFPLHDLDKPEFGCTVGECCM